jgi:peptidoglycan/xylan/chitin deacetylase (PgdA/CDA1 family)
MTQAARWPNGKRIAVAVAVMFETWPEGKAPSYSVQTTHLKPGTQDHAGHAWSTYGGRVGADRILRCLDRTGVPATFFTNARCTEIYPEVTRRIVAAGHDIAAHGYTQDQLPAYMTPDEEESAIRLCADIIAERSGKRPTGWLSPVLAFTPHTATLLARNGFRWHADVTYTDRPHRVETGGGVLAAVPFSDFTDNRVLRSNPNDLFDIYCSTFDYLYENEPGSLLVLGLHCHFGGRPLVTAVFEQIFKRLSQFSDVWFSRHIDLADWVLN